jgi:hypothetical protein
MTALQLENKLAHTYLGRIEKFSPEVKLDLITEIILSMKVVKKPKVSREEYYSGAWDSEQTAEEIIADLMFARGTSTRQIMDLD